MGVDRAELKDAKANLMFKLSTVSHIRAFPFWEIVVKDHVFCIDQVGEVFGKLELSIPGD